MELDTSDIDAQIAALQATKAAQLAKIERARALQQKEEDKILVGTTPTKASLRDSVKDVLPPSRPAQPNFGTNHNAVAQPKPTVQALPSIVPPRKQGMTSSLAALRRSNSSHSSQSPMPRSSNLSHRPEPRPESSKSARQASPESKPNDKGKEKELVRDEDSLTVIENLTLGPKEFGIDPEGENEWIGVEPNSGIRLSKRILPHASVQDHMYGRYYITPSQLYSVIRMSRDGTTYDIPVEGDWITVAVVAHRGEVKVSGMKDGPIASDDEDEDELGNEGTGDLFEEGKPNVNIKAVDGKGKDKDKSKGKGKGKNHKDKTRRRVPRKYINFTLCSLPPRNTKLGSTGSTGDALLQLLLFEADAVVREEKDDADGEIIRIYRGGSGGAYERWCNLTEGSVIAILNPRVWKNLRGGSSGPHPLEFPLGLNPASGDAIALIGQARDLGCCTAIQKDGNRCKSWVDLRQSQVCEYHVHAAVQRGRAGRAEFTASTSSFALSARRSGNMGKGTTPYDSKRKTGLLPRNGAQAAPRILDNGGGGATYIVGGGVINTGPSGSSNSSKGFGEEYISEKLGRSRLNKRKRLEEKEAEKVLERLLERDGGGSSGAKYLAVLDKNKEKAENLKGSIAAKTTTAMAMVEERKRPFSATAIKRIGFDPTARAGVRDGEDIQKRLDAISSLNKEPGCRLERLSKRLADEKAEAEKVKAEAAARKKALVVKEEEGSDDEDMVDLD